MAHLCILVAVIDGTAALRLKIDERVLWSVTIVNDLPYTYLWNFFNSKYISMLGSPFLLAHNFYLFCSILEEKAIGHSHHMGKDCTQAVLGNIA